MYASKNIFEEGFDKDTRFINSILLRPGKIQQYPLAGIFWGLFISVKEHKKPKLQLITTTARSY